MISKKIKIRGVVQGVGFRPFVWNLANNLQLTGYVQNGSDGVVIRIQGCKDKINIFMTHIVKDCPPLAIISSIVVKDSDIKKFTRFDIIESYLSEDINTRISPDIIICDDCKMELFNKNNRRYRYPFINCVNCGPRFSIIDQIPYDRINTSMSSFEMCPSCSKEYADPIDRRFHAQPIACHDCGPKISFLNSRGEPVDGDWESLWVKSIQDGMVVAVKGIGGFHLACDAHNTKALQILRRKKNRENKPFAVMVNDLSWIKKYCYFSTNEENLLLSKESPIVILKIKSQFDGLEYIAPGLDTIGVMVPYTPMHLLMMEKIKCPIILTSANYSNEPMISDNNSALNSLRDIADRFIIHDRQIVNRCDDSITLCCGDHTTVIRPGRGFSPFNININSCSIAVAFGADLKNTFSILNNGTITVSPFIGDLEHPETQEIFQNLIYRNLDFYKINPEFVIHDKHPDFYSTSFAVEYAKKYEIPSIAVQHHHAHLVAGYIEHNLKGKAIGFAFDGTGYGLDGTIWGGEVFLFDDTQFNREYHFKKMFLPGGDLAVREPARIAISLSNTIPIIDNIVENLCSEDYVKSITMQLNSKINCPESSSVARLFDVVSFMLDLCSYQTYDGEAAMKLEAVADINENGILPFRVKGRIIDCSDMFIEIHQLLKKGIGVNKIAGRFHNMITEIIYFSIKKISQFAGPLPVVFSGGVFQNRLLVEKILLHKMSVENKLFFSSLPNDSGISIGQAAVGAALNKKYED